MSYPKNQPVPKFGLTRCTGKLAKILVGETLHGKFGEIIEIVITGDGVSYGLTSVPGTFNKTLYFKEYEIE
jgi:hypothetical protein